MQLGLGWLFVVFLLPGICGGDIYLGQTDGRTLYRYIDPAASSVNNAVHCCLISLTSVHNAHYTNTWQH